MKRDLVWLFLLLTAVYTLTYSGVFHSDDERSVAAAADSLVTQGTLTIDQLRWNQDASGGIGKYGLDGHLYSKYGWGASLAVAPFAAAAAMLPGLGSTQAENLLNILVTALTGVLVAACAARMAVGRRAALALGLLFGLATLAWPYAKTLFGEPISGLLLLAAFHQLLTYRDEGGWRPLALAGVALAAAVAVKTANAAAIPVFALQLAVYLWRAPERRSLRSYVARLVAAGAVMAAPVVVAGLVTLWYNFARFGDALDAGYLAIERFSGRLDQGIPGLLLSPGRGLIFYVPLVWLLVPALPAFWRKWRAEAIVILLLAVSQTLLYARWHVWFGGWCWGPRFLAPLMPFLVLLLGVWLERTWRDPSARLARAGVVAVAGLSVAVQVLGLSVDFNMYLRTLLNQRPELGAGIAYLTVDNPAYSPLLGQLGLLKPGNLDFAWLHTSDSTASVDWSILLPALAFVAAAAALPWVAARLRSWRLPAVGVTLLGIFALWQSAAWGTGAGRYGPVANDYAAIFDLVGEQAHPGDAMLFVAPERSDLLLNAGSLRLPVYAPLQKKWPLAAREVAMMGQAARAGGRLWVVTEDLPDAGSGYEHWLGLEAGKLWDREVGPALISLYAIPPVGMPAAPAEQVNRRFGDALALEGYTLWPWPARRGRTLFVTLYWRAAERPPADYRVSVRLYGSEGRSLSAPALYQRDAAPADGFAPTSGWSPGQRVVDRRALIVPAALPAGTATLAILMYDPVTGAALSLDDGGQAVWAALAVEP